MIHMQDDLRKGRNGIDPSEAGKKLFSKGLIGSERKGMSRCVRIHGKGGRICHPE